MVSLVVALSTFTLLWMHRYNLYPDNFSIFPNRNLLLGCHLWSRTESDTTEATERQQQQQSLSHVQLFCDPMDCSKPGSSVLHYLPEFAQIHVL